MDLMKDIIDMWAEYWIQYYDNKKLAQRKEDSKNRRENLEHQEPETSIKRRKPSQN